jgi:putative ribosome biogenesis GTPase RsgA
MGAALVIPLIYVGGSVLGTAAAGGLAYGIKVLIDFTKVPPKAPTASATIWARKRGITTEEYLKSAKTTIGISRKKYNVVLCGKSGAGKSKLVSSITGDASIRSGAEGETTKKPAGYPVPGSENL